MLPHQYSSVALLNVIINTKKCRIVAVMSLVCRHLVPCYCSVSLDTSSHRVGGATVVVEL